MEYFRQIEEDVRNIGVEAKKRHPEIRDAAERALLALKSIRETYVADLRRNNNEENSVNNKPSLPQSSDILAPYILACNYADGSPKLITMALNGVQMLLNFELVPYGDIKNILR
eukprot:gene14215-19074_t